MNLESEIATHRNRIVELKADLHDLATQVRDMESELDAEQTILGTLEAMASAEAPREQVSVTPRRRAVQEG